MGEWGFCLNQDFQDIFFATLLLSDFARNRFLCELGFPVFEDFQDVI
jgi:hypothetical protein